MESNGIYVYEYFKNIFLEYYNPLCLYALKYVKNTEVAEDIVQDVFASVWSHRNDLDLSLPIRPLLYKYTHNKAIDHLKNKSSNIERLDNTTYKQLNDYIDTLIINQPDEILNFNELNKEIQKYIDRLPDQCRIIYNLSRVANLKNREIAEKLNISIKTVEKHISKAISEIRKHLHDEGFLSLLIIILFFS